MTTGENGRGESRGGEGAPSFTPKGPGSPRADADRNRLDDLRSTAVTAAVEAGAAFLDIHYPGWRSRVDVHNYHVANLATCALAWASGDYVHAVATHRLGVKSLIGYGFMASTEHTVEALRLAWVSEYINHYLETDAEVPIFVCGPCKKPHSDQPAECPGAANCDCQHKGTPDGR